MLSASVPATTTDQAAQTDVLLSESAIRRIKELSSGQPTTSMLRLAVDAGGCSGFQYSFTLATPEEVTEEDQVFEHDGASVVVDDLSLGFVRGSTVDYSEELIRASFQVIDNPNAESGCGCGSSFIAK